MALNGTLLGNEIKTELKKVFKDVDDKQMQNVCNAIGNAIVKHIASFGVVSTTVTGTCATPVGAGTITGSGTGGVS